VLKTYHKLAFKLIRLQTLIPLGPHHAARVPRGHTGNYVGLVLTYFSDIFVA